MRLGLSVGEVRSRARRTQDTKRRFGAAGKVETMVLAPGGLLAWLAVGAIAGWLAGQLVAGGGFGILGDIIVGLIGAFIGGWLFTVLLPNSSVGFLGSIAVAFVGAAILVVVVRTLTFKRRFGP